MTYIHSVPQRYRNAAKLLEKIAPLAQYTKCKQHEALTYFKLAECNKKLQRYETAIANLTKAAQIAGKIKNIHMVRDIRLTQIEIYDIKNDKQSKQDVIELYLEDKYNIKKALQFMDEHDNYYTIKCKYEYEEAPQEEKIQLVLVSNDSDHDLDTDSDDDIEILSVSKRTKPETQTKKRKRERKKSRFEESSDEDNDDLCVVQLHKRRKLNTDEDNNNNNNNNKDEDETTTIADLQSINAPIMDLCSDEEAEEKEREFDEIIESQNSEEIDSDLLDPEIVNAYFEGGYQCTIDEIKHELQQLSVIEATDIDHIIKICGHKVSIADTLMEKAKYIKDNEPKTIEMYKLRRSCYKEAISYAKDVPMDCEPFINKQQHMTHSNINIKYSKLMSHYFASLELFGKYLISKKDWNEGIKKYNEYLTDKLVDRKTQTVHPLIVLHWRYFCTSNIAYCYRQNATYKNRCRARNYYEKSCSILNQLSSERNTIANNDFLRKNVLNGVEIDRQSAYSQIELGHTFDELCRWNDAQKCYQRAAEIASKYKQYIDQELDAYFNLALTLHHTHDYRRALYIFQTHCIRCVNICIDEFCSSEFRMTQFDIHRWICDILLQQKQMKSAKQTAQKLQHIATKYLCKHQRYIKEAKKYVKACEIKTKYQSQVNAFMHQQNATNEAQYKCLRRLFELKSFGNIVENKNKYLDLMDNIKNTSSSLYIRYMIAIALKEKEHFNYAQSLLMDAMQNMHYKQANNASSLIPKMAFHLAELCEFTNTETAKRIQILIKGAQFILSSNSFVKSIDFDIEYLQTLLYLYDTYAEKEALKSYHDDIQQIRNKLSSLVTQHPNHRSVSNNNVMNGIQRRNRYRISRHSYSRSHRNQYRNTNNKSNTNNHNTKNQQQKRKQSAIMHIRSNHQIQDRNEYKARYKTYAAKRMQGLNKNSSAEALQNAINYITKLLCDHPSDLVIAELTHMKEAYESYLSQSKHKAIASCMQQQLVVCSKNIRNNVIGIVHESFEWIYLKPSANENWNKFDAHQAQLIENEYRKEMKIYRCKSYKIKFNDLSNYKNRKSWPKVQRRVSLQSLHPRKMFGWCSFWMRNEKTNKDNRYVLERNTTEYNSIYTLLKNRGLSGGLNVCRIERVQNVTNQMRYNNCKIENQLLLFHGTRPSSVRAIIDEGTDFRLHGDNGTKYGDGSYFAVYASYAAQFANESQIDVTSGKMVRYMFLCAVKAGQYCLGAQGLRRPPKKGNKFYDSVVDHIHHPSIFVTFDNSMSLPLYLITFTFNEK